MSLISKTQLIKDIADAYRTASGTSDLVRYDELTQKISELSTESAIIKNVTMDSVTELTITDQDDVEHEVVPTYTNNRITSITYDGTSMAVTYDGDGNLTKVGNCDIDGTEEYIGTGIVPSGSMNITENGTYDVTEKAIAEVNVPSAELNIAYGQTAPTDTTKLWVKTSEPSSLEIASDLDIGTESINSITNTPFAISGSGCVTVGDIIYIFGGMTSSDTSTNKIWTYDNTTNAYTELATTIPTAMGFMGCQLVGEKVYLFGGLAGSTPQSIICCFDTTDNSIETLQVSLPTATHSMPTGLIGTSIFLIGGADVTKIYKFETTTNTLTELPVALPYYIGFANGCTIGDKIYVFNGYDGSVLNTIYCFDTTNNTFTLKKTTSQSLYGVSAVSIDNNCYLFGGKSGGYETPITSIRVYDPYSNTISPLTTTIPIGTCMNGITVKENSIFIFGGNLGGNTISKYAYKFIKTSPLTSGKVFIQENLTNNKFDLLSAPTKVEIGVYAVYKGNSSNEAEVVEAYLYDEDEEEWVLI